MRTEMVFARLTGKVPDVVYHYCGPDALVGILQSRQIWATSVRHLNDTSERIYAAKLVRSVAQRLASGPLELTPAALLIQRAEEAISYLACFSEHADQLSQWRAYTPPTGGFSIGIRTSQLASSGDWLFGRCEYDQSNQLAAIAAILQDHPVFLDPSASLERLMEADNSEVGSFIAALLTLVPLLKHSGFSEEAEWRIVRETLKAEAHLTEFRVSRGVLVPYQRIALVDQGVPLPIAEIIIGPCPDATDRTVKATRQLLNQHELQSCDLRISGIPYRA